MIYLTKVATVIALILFISQVGLTQTQGVAINNDGSPPRPGTILDISAHNLAVSLPWADTALILTPDRGYLIYDDGAEALYQYNGLHWVRLLDAAAFRYYFVDRDGDGYGDRFGAMYAVQSLPGYVPDSTDCNDANPDLSPGQPELCDGIDNDCDPLSQDGSDEAIFGTPCDGPDADLCEEGTWICSGGALTCSDLTGDSSEVCDSLDNDCDGWVDEGCGAPINITWGNLQWPPGTTTSVNTTTELIFGQVYALGVTDTPVQGLGIIAQLGYGPDGSDPSLGGWTWVDATYNVDFMNNDEYMATLTVATAGTYDYAYRYSGDDGTTWLYCDFDPGSSNGYNPANAGDLVVNP